MVDYDYPLPPERIAQSPLPRRRDSRLLVWRAGGEYEHRRFADVVDLLQPDDLVVLNDTRVFAARLYGRKESGEVEVEVLLVRPLEEGGWAALVRPGRRLRPGTRVVLAGGVRLEIGSSLPDRLRQVTALEGGDLLEICRHHGHVPLPPYIRREDVEDDRERYQTVFAREEGSVAAPTAGLHFDEDLLDSLRDRQVATARVTLHVGPGTFRPLSEEVLAAGRLHAEWREVPASTLRALRACRGRGGRVVAVGTTVCRSLESLPEPLDPGTLADGVRGDTRLMIRPGHRFRWTDVLVTNFHLPRSSLLLLVDAFAGPRWREAYALAVREGYRFYSYGDANWIEVAP